MQTVIGLDPRDHRVRPQTPHHRERPDAKLRAELADRVEVSQTEFEGAFALEDVVNTESGEVLVEDGVVALRLELIAVVGVVVVLVLWREMLEVHRLARIRPDVGGHEHQPGQHLRAVLRRV